MIETTQLLYGLMALTGGSLFYGFMVHRKVKGLTESNDKKDALLEKYKEEYQKLKKLHAELKEENEKLDGLLKRLSEEKIKFLDKENDEIKRVISEKNELIKIINNKTQEIEKLEKEIKTHQNTIKNRPIVYKTEEKGTREKHPYRAFKESNKKKGDYYESFVAKKYMEEGYEVELNGMKKGYDDQGIDLIAYNDEEALLIQCKFRTEVNEKSMITHDDVMKFVKQADSYEKENKHKKILQNRRIERWYICSLDIVEYETKMFISNNKELLFYRVIEYDKDYLHKNSGKF